MEELEFVFDKLEPNGNGLVLSRNEFIDLLHSLDSRIYFLKSCAKNYRKRNAHSLANETYYQIDKLERLQYSLTKLLD